MALEKGRYIPHKPKQQSGWQVVHSASSSYTMSNNIFSN